MLLTLKFPLTQQKLNDDWDKGVFDEKAFHKINYKLKNGNSHFWTNFDNKNYKPQNFVIKKKSD